MSSFESALVVLVPEAEAAVKSFRDLYDPSAAAGCPAHITLLYPFKAPLEIDSSVVAALRGCFARISPFQFSLSMTRRFPGVLYLAPEPAEPFRQMTLSVWHAYPETPPYAGRHPDIVPHLCVAQLADEERLDRVSRRFANKSDDLLPIQAKATAVALIDNRAGRWRSSASFQLGTECPPPSEHIPLP